MTPERWSRVLEVFKAAIDREPEERATFLDAVCHADEDFRRQVEDLISSHARTAIPTGETAVPRADEALTSTHSRLSEAEGPDVEIFNGTERFSVRRRLGAGSFGVVYEAYDREKGSVVALKVLRKSDPGSIYRFKLEFRALADIVHPNLISLYELLSDNKQWFFTMKLVEGANFLQYVRGDDRAGSAAHTDNQPIRSTLLAVGAESFREADADARSTKLLEAGEPPSLPAVVNLPRRRGPLDFDRLRATLGQLVEGVCALHEAGIIHRDLKPSNVLVTPGGRVALLDFGLVTEIAPHERHQSMGFAGTPAYMAPEQGAMLPMTEAGDWYSVGVMLYEALTGQVPFSGQWLDILRDKQVSEAPEPRLLAPDVPTDLNDLCLDLLKRDPKLRPSGREILFRLGRIQVDRGEVAPPEHLSKPQAPFIGRESHLAALAGALAAVREGRTVTVYVRGRSGMGKTALIRHFLAGLREIQPDVVVLAGRCYEQESVPFKTLDSLVDALSRYLKRLPSAAVEALIPRDILALARLFPVLRQVEAVANARRRVLSIPDSQELRRRAFAALRELLARLADQRLVILAIDDLQWGDLDSVALMSELLRPPDPPSLLLIASYRAEDAEASLPLQTLLQSGPSVDFRSVEVAELSPAEAHKLARALLGNAQPASAGRAAMIARESGASPLFIHELVRYLLAGNYKTGRRNEGGGRHSFKALSGTTLDEVIWTRISQLPEEARRLLEVVAVAGKPIPLDVAKSATKLDHIDYQAFIILRSERLIRIRETQKLDEIETYHDRVRNAVMGHLSSEALKTHHFSLSLALEASGYADLETLAIHFEGAGNHERAAECFAAAADRAAEAFAFDRAARLYHSALELRPLPHTERRALLVKLGQALANAGRGAEAARVYLDAARNCSLAEARELQRSAAEQLLRSGHVDEGMTVLRMVLNSMDMRLAETPQRALLSLLARRAQVRLRGLSFRERDASQISAEELTRIDTCWAVAVGLGMVDVIRGSDFQARHLLLALKSGEPFRVARALALEAVYAATAGGPSEDRVARLLQEATALASVSHHAEAVGCTLLASGVAAFLIGQWGKARELIGGAERILREQCAGVTWELYTAHHFWLRSQIFLGEWSAVAERLPALLKEAQERGDLLAETNLWTRISYIPRLAADEVVVAKEELDQGLKSWSRQGFHTQHFYDLLRQVEVALYSGEGAAAWALVSERWPALERSLMLRIQVARIETLHLRARSALAAAAEPMTASGSPTNISSLLKSAEGDAGKLRREKMPWADSLAQLVLAGIAASRGGARDAVALLTSAEVGFESVGMTLHAAAARRRHGELVGGERGGTLVKAADSSMADRGIRNPGRLVTLLAPGKWS